MYSTTASPPARLEIDATELPHPKLLKTVSWLTDPRRRAIAKSYHPIGAIYVSNAHATIWNGVTQERVNRIKNLDPEIGYEVSASLIYDTVKTVIFYETYRSIGDYIFVPPSKEIDEKYRDTPHHSHRFVETSDIVSCNKGNIDFFISEHDENLEKLRLMTFPHIETDERVRMIVDQMVSSRLTSVFFESAEVRARMKDIDRIQGMDTKIDDLGTKITEFNSLKSQMERMESKMDAYFSGSSPSAKM